MTAAGPDHFGGLASPYNMEVCFQDTKLVFLGAAALRSTVFAAWRHERTRDVYYYLEQAQPGEVGSRQVVAGHEFDDRLTIEPWGLYWHDVYGFSEVEVSLNDGSLLVDRRPLLPVTFEQYSAVTTQLGNLRKTAW